jgi:hypothetical protein
MVLEKIIFTGKRPTANAFFLTFPRSITGNVDIQYVLNYKRYNVLLLDLVAKVGPNRRFFRLFFFRLFFSQEAKSQKPFVSICNPMYCRYFDI